MVKANPIRRRVRSTVLVNPQRKKRSSGAHRATAKRNPGSLITLGYLNPQEKTKVSKRKAPKAKRNPRRVAKNPLFAKSAKKAVVIRHKSRRNPNILSKPVDMMKMAAYAALGLIATRQVPQIVLGARNVGVVGYAANFVTAAGSAAVAKKAMGNEAAVAVLIGGSLYAFNRLLNDFTPLGKTLNLSGIGDTQASGSLRGLVAAYQPNLVVTASGQPVLPAAFVDKMRSMLPPPAAAPAVKSSLNGASFGRRAA